MAMACVGYGYNNFWSRPYPFYGVFMIHLILFGDITILLLWIWIWLWIPIRLLFWWRPYNSWYNYSPYGRNLNTNISFVSGRRGSRNALHQDQIIFLIQISEIDSTELAQYPK